MQATTHCIASPNNNAACLNHWRTAMSLGNRAFEHADYSGAIEHYKVAHLLAESLFGHIDDAESGIAAFVIARHNLADACERLSRHDEQAFHLCAAHERLCSAMNDGDLPESWRLAAFRHSRRTYAELTRFLNRHPGHASASATCALGAAGPVSTRHVQ